MGKIIAIANQKGGVGKTTTCINLAASMAATKRRILLIDMDPQGNATMGSGINKVMQAESLNEVLLGSVSIEKTIVTNNKYDVLPSNSSLTVAEIRLLKMEQREQRLRQVLSPMRALYDFILVDCPPSLNMLTVNALVSADKVIIPVQCEYYALEGLAGLINTIEQLRRNSNQTLQIEGLLRTMYDGRNRLSVDVSEQLLKHFGNKVYQTIIPRNVRLAEAPSHGLPILYYDERSQGAIAYLALAGEVLRRQLET